MTHSCLIMFAIYSFYGSVTLQSMYLHVYICMNMAKYIVIETVSPVLCTTERTVPQYSITPSMVTQNSQYLVSMFIYLLVCG